MFSFNRCNSIEVPEYVQRSAWPEPLCTQHLGAPADATRNWFSFYKFHNSDIFYRCAFYDPKKTGLMEKFAKERGLATIKNRIEYWSESKTNLDAQTFMARMRNVQQIEKEEKKRHDAKIDKLITTALQHDDAFVRFDPPNRGTEKNVVFGPDHRFIKAASPKFSEECINDDDYDDEDDLFGEEEVNVVETRVATIEDVNEARKDMILGAITTATWQRAKKRLNRHEKIFLQIAEDKETSHAPIIERFWEFLKRDRDERLTKNSVSALDQSWTLQTQATR